MKTQKRTSKLQLSNHEKYKADPGGTSASGPDHPLQTKVYGVQQLHVKQTSAWSQQIRGTQTKK